MTTISAGAAAGLLVALMVMSTSDGFGAERRPVTDRSGGLALPGATKGFNRQPDPPKFMGDGSVRPTGL